MEAEIAGLRATIEAKDANLADLRTEVLRLTHDQPKPPSRRWWQLWRCLTKHTSASFQPVKPTAVSKKTTQTINFTLAADKPLSAEERAQLAQLAAMPDEDIDFSDIPRSSPNTKWTRPGLMMTSENKQQVTLRLDREVLDFFRSSGRRYQTKINAVLRAFVESQSHR